MKAKILVPGVVVFVVGAFFVVMPGVFGQLVVGLGVSPGPTQSLYLVKIAPGNYSYLSYNMDPNAQLSVTIAAGPQPVDFFLMSPGNFSLWNRASTSSSQPYPQSAFNVKNYSFGISGAGTPRTYYLVFVPRSNGSRTDVLVHYSLQDAASSSVTTVPEIFLGVGVIVTLVGAKGRGKKEALEVARAAGPPPPAATGGSKCRYCGEELKGDVRFCASCGRSQR